MGLALAKEQGNHKLPKGQMPKARKPLHAGSWYEDDGEALKS